MIEANTTPVRLQRLRRWLLALERHTRETSDEEARFVARWSRGEMQMVLDDLLELRDVLVLAYKRAGRYAVEEVAFGNDRFTLAEVRGWLGLDEGAARRGNINRILWAGALLYSDIAMRVPAEDRGVVGRAQAVRLQDGQFDGTYYSAAPAWEAARALLDKIRPDPAMDASVALWYRATAAFLLDGQPELSDAEIQLDRGRRLFPSDPDLLFYSGCLHELYTSGSLYEAARSVPLPPGRTLDLGSTRSHLRAAANFFQQAVSANAQLVEARIRLGHVLGLLNRHEEAAAELRRAVAAVRDPRLVYYTQMLLGREEQALGHREAARVWYERAAATCPDAQSPIVALSQLALQSGDRTGAVRATDRLLRLRADGSTDPWAEYLVTTGTRPGVLIAQLLASVPVFSKQ